MCASSCARAGRRTCRPASASSRKPRSDGAGVMAPLGAIDFVVLTGFLGSGKTTLLRETGTGIPMATLSNGCVCCQIGNDLQTTIDALLWAPRPGAEPLRRIVLETSGLSKPGPVLRQLAGLPADRPEHRLRVSVLATFDAASGLSMAQFDEAAAQWAAAHRIVVTKADMVDAVRLAAAVEEVEGLNPLAEIVAGAVRADIVRAAFAPLAGGPIREPPAPRASHPRVTVALARPTGVLRYDDLAAWLDNLAGALGSRLLRVKGLVRVAGQPRPVLVQSVGTMFSPPRLFAGEQASASFVVVIAQDTDP